MGKIAGGVVGITRNESSLNRWGITYIARSQMSQSTKEMFGVDSTLNEDEIHHKELGCYHTARDYQNVHNQVSLQKHRDVFKLTNDPVTNIMNGDMATDEI